MGDISMSKICYYSQGGKKMATRPGYTIVDGKIVGVNASFVWSAGFAPSQKQKNIKKLHEALGGKALEVSTKSTEELGKKLSAFNLKLGGYTLENIFQSSKTFENGGPYTDLLYVTPKQAKTDPRLRSSGELVAFHYDGMVWPLLPKTAFYDYIYVKSVKECISKEELERITEYDFFTDIEFNPAKSVNTQARAVAIVKLLVEKFGEIPEMNMSDFIKYHKMVVTY